MSYHARYRVQRSRRRPDPHKLGLTDLVCGIRRVRGLSEIRQALQRSGEEAYNGTVSGDMLCRLRREGRLCWCAS